MTRSKARWAVCAVSAAMVAPSVAGQMMETTGAQPSAALGVQEAQAREAAEKEDLAESILSQREAAMGRKLDAGYRGTLKAGLVAAPLGRLESLESAGGQGDLRAAVRDPQPALLGDSSADLVYTPVVPCRVFDTRFSTAGILVANTQRNFVISGATDLSGQGGSATGCGIPFGPATSVMINFAAVAPTGNGNLRAWAVADPQPPAPLAAVMNYDPDLFALANGIAVPICDPAGTSCVAGDLRLQADVSSVHVVGDVVGFFRRFTAPVFRQGTFVGRTIPAAPNSALLSNITFTPAASGTARLSGQGWCNVEGSAGTFVEIDFVAGTDAIDAFAQPLSGWGVIRLPAGSATGTHAVGLSTERTLTVTAGVTRTVTLFARHLNAPGTPNCSGTFTVQTVF